MHKNMPYICDLISKPSGGQLLELLTSVYEGIHDEELLEKESGERALEQATNLGLLKLYKKGQIILTSLGYIVGNVAKEYFHWLNNNRQMPPPYPPDDFIKGMDVLDLGCSFGRWLWRFQKNAKSVVGLELQQEFIELGRALAKRECIPCPEIRQGSAEELSSHIANNSIDFVFARLVLNEVYVGKTLSQIANVLRQGGIVWAQVYHWYDPFQFFLRRDKGRDLRNKCYVSFGIVNSIIFMTTHRQMSIRSQGRMHSVHKIVYPTLKTWKAAFARYGLCNFREIQSDVFWARKL
jgi:SAM-dependent methyltransferase